MFRIKTKQVFFQQRQDVVKLANLFNLHYKGKDGDIEYENIEKKMGTSKQ